MRFTILGSSGFIGSHIKKYLENFSRDCNTPPRDKTFLKSENLGHVIYCIGYTADFRQKPFETVKSHICKLIEVMENSRFESFLYLSSARVYSGGKSGNENDPIITNPLNFSDLYNISKIMGESICLSIPNEKVRVARISNVVGNDFKSNNFLFSLIKDAVDKKIIILHSSLSSSKDYIMIEDVVKLITLIAENGTQRIYNIASGYNIENEQIVNEIVQNIFCEIEVVGANCDLIFPQISIEKIKNEFSFKPQNILSRIAELINLHKKTYDTD